LCHLNDQSLTSELQKKAMTKLIGLQYKFQYKKGSDNKPADALSRVAHNMQLQALSVVQPDARSHSFLCCGSTCPRLVTGVSYQWF
jgi:hypothetical protein